MSDAKRSGLDAVRAASTWTELSSAVADWAKAQGVDPDAALAELAGPGALSQLLCSEAQVVRPVDRGGRRRKPAWDEFVVLIVDLLKREGLRGSALWTRAHYEIATSDSLMGEGRNVTPAAIRMAYGRAKKCELNKT